MNGMFLSVLGLGFVLGLKHALDPDHMVAVSTIVSESKSVKRSSVVGTFWGLGHTLSLLSAVAGLIYIAVFGLGSVGGMLIMSSVISLPFVFAQKYFKVLGEAMQLIIGLSSVTFGVFTAWQIGFQQI